MFTGIIQDLGIIQSFQNERLIVAAGQNIKDVKLGDSIAVNGICLTVVKIRKNILEFDVSAETLKKSTFKTLKKGEKVNLEPALTLSGKLGGHMVSGHVDGVGEIRKKIAAGKGFELYLSIPSDLLRYLAIKGSITMDGISLTVADIRDDLVVISIVPHTAATTNLGNKKVGDLVNIEVDLLSKYIERHLNQTQTSISEDTLTRAGFMPMGWIEN